MQLAPAEAKSKTSFKCRNEMSSSLSVTEGCLSLAMF
jgi:hypothetical protein